MQHTRRQEQYGNHHLSVYYRHRSVCRHAHRLASLLLRMACRGTGAFSLGRLGGLLWKQVGAGPAWLWYSPSANLLSVRQGLIRLLLATTVELQPLVRPVGSLWTTSPITALRRRY